MSDIAALPKVRALLEQGIERKLHLGAQLYVSLRGECVSHFAVGESRAGIAMKPETVSLWLSSCKPITAIAIGQLIDQGLISLDDHVDRYVPGFGSGGKEGITIRNLLTHTGGFRGADLLSENLAWRETIEGICATPLELGWTPGQKAGYHISSSWYLLGEVIQRLIASNFSDHIQKTVLGPAGMAGTWFSLSAESYAAWEPRMSIMHIMRPIPKERPFWNTAEGCASPRPGSSARGPIRDLGRFYEMLLDRDTPLLRPETLRQFVSRQRQGMFDHTFNHVVDWGFGFCIDSNRYGAETIPYGYGLHASPETFGHSGAQSSAAFADPAHGLVVAWVCNGMPGEPAHQRRARDINTAIYEELEL